MRPSWFLAVVLGLLCLGVAAAEPGESPKVLRERVLKPSTPDDKAKAYRELFEKVGRAGMAELMKDEDTGIALQAAWEFHKKVVKRPMGDVHDIYDVDELKKFVEFIKERTKAPVPEWWAKAILNVNVLSGQGHAFGKLSRNPNPKLNKSKAGVLVPEGAELEQKEGTYFYNSGGRKVEFPTTVFDHDEVFNDAMVAVITQKRSVIVSYSTWTGFQFKMASFDGKGGEPSWKADIWATERGFMSGPRLVNHWVELTEKDVSVFVFGAESNGMYIELFDFATGKFKFRFCTCYWGNFSEKWELK